jgi:cobalt/nickel transport system permease protein
VPTTAVALLAVTYRYLLVLFDELARAVRARRARTIRAPSLRGVWRDSGSSLGSFLLRTIERGERVERAARARGARSGSGVRYDPPAERLGLADAAFGVLVVAVVALAVVA